MAHLFLSSQATLFCWIQGVNQPFNTIIRQNTKKDRLYCQSCISGSIKRHILVCKIKLLFSPYLVQFPSPRKNRHAASPKRVCLRCNFYGARHHGTFLFELSTDLSRFVKQSCVQIASILYLNTPNMFFRNKIINVPLSVIVTVVLFFSLLPKYGS